jgi:hypothetical protein
VGGLLRQAAGVDVTEIEKAIRKLSLQPRWSVDQAIGFGKLALQVALEDCARWKDRTRADELEHFKIAADLAKKAHKALQMLLNHIGPSGLHMHLGTTLMSRNKAMSVKIGYAPFKEQIQTWADASLQIEKLHVSARRHWLTKQNEPDYAKRAFVYRLAEAWIFLTGKKPGGGRDPLNNPFLRFVGAAAEDAGIFGAAEDFYSSLRSVLKDLHQHERWDDKGETQQSISGIAARGPVWLE